MNVMKIMKFVVLGLVLSTGIVFLPSCSDNDSKTTVLLRPVTVIESERNSVKLKWQFVEDATEYIIELYQSTESGYVLYKTYIANQTSYTIEDLDWDEKYKIKVKSSGNGRESAYWETNEIAVSYPTKLGGTKTIDNAAKVTWKEGGNTITALKAFSEDGTEEKTFSDIDYAAGEAIIKGLTPKTSYKICAYSGSEQSVNTYEGRVMITTQPAENYDEQYGSGKWVDLREVIDPRYFNSDDFWSSLVDGTTFILSGGTRFEWGDRKALEKSVSFVTGLTLGDNATFLIKNAFSLSKSIELLSFKNIDFVGVIDDAYNIRPVEEEVSKSFSSKQVFNVNGSNSILNTISFTNCSFNSFRALVRLQAASDGVKNIIFKECNINGVGDQGAVTTNNQSAIMESLLFENCTISNVVMLVDLRASATAPVFTVSNCTFCYAPLEGTSNQLFRISKNTVNTTIANTVFGSPLAADGGGVFTNKAGTQPSRMSDSKTFNPTNSNCWKTNFTMDSGCPFVGASDTGMNETGLFSDPARGDFKLIGQFGGSTSAGAIKWRS